MLLRLPDCMGLLALLTLPLLAPRAGAQFDVLVSLVSDDALAGAPVFDDELLTQAPGARANVSWPRQTLSLLAGDGPGSLHLVLGDIDAVHDEGGPVASAGLHLSLVSDEAGFLDGDILRPGPAGLEIVVAEAAFVAATGASDGNVDVDAFHRDGDGTLLFSFADDEASSLLSGDSPGVLQDGDVLRWPAGAATAEVLFTASQVDAMVSAALGTSASTGDTKGLARDPGTGAVLFVVQAPSAHDGSVFTTAGGGALLGGHQEQDFGFDGDVELDALAVASAAWPGLSPGACCPQPGEALTVTLRGAAPGVPHACLLAFDTGPSLLPTLGWGGLVLASDALLGEVLQLLPAHTVVPDGQGEAQLTFQVPPALPPVDVVLQAVSLPWPHVASNPVLVEVAQ